MSRIKKPSAMNASSKWREPPMSKQTPVRAFAVGTALGLLAGLGAVFLDRKMGASKDNATSPRTAASGPQQFPAATWRHIAVRTWKSFNDDQIAAVGAGVTFFGLLAMFPALGAFVALYGLFADVHAAQKQISAMQGLLPSGAVSVIGDQITRLTLTNHRKLGATFLVSLLLSIWSSNAGLKGLNVAYEEKESRGFIQLNLVSLAFTMGATIFAILSIAAVVAAPGLLSALGFASFYGVSLLRWPALLLIVIALLSLVFRFGPDRAQAKWRWITPGSSFAAIAWIGMSIGFSWYVANFGSYDRTYGALGAVVGLMTWIWLSTMVVLLGAELNSEIEKHTSADTTTGPPKPIGQRGAAVADGDRLEKRQENPG
jgi:membrane protein